jgi:hypothetical protein
VADLPVQTFSSEVDMDDNETMAIFLDRLATFIDYHQSREAGFDEESRIRPIEGTFIEDFIRDVMSEDNALLEYQSDDESDDQDALESLKHLTAYWKPRGGDISILPAMYAREISRLTGASLYAEEAEKRYRIYQGNFTLAQQKLVRLEPLLVRSSPASLILSMLTIVLCTANFQSSASQ